MLLRVLWFSVLFSLVPAAFAQPSDRRISKQEYITNYKDDAIREMLTSGVPASITLAQGMLESDYGNSPLARYANNHFGIKCHKGWSGPSFIQDDDEKNECFRKYYSAYDSYKDHSEFLSTRSRYAALFELKVTDYKGWARGLKKAGYATNPRYADLLIRIIEDNELDQFDKEVKMPVEAPTPEVVLDKMVDERPPIRTVEVHDNNIRFIKVQPGDTYHKLAQEYRMGLWQLYKYNDLHKGDQLTPGMVLYLQPKRSKAKTDFHVAKEGETMWDISQAYGVKLKKLYKKNNMTPGARPRPGQKISLKKQLKEAS